MAKHSWSMGLASVLWLGSVAVAQHRAVPAATAAAQVARIKVQPDLAPDCSSLKAIAESVTRGCKTNDAKAIAICNFALLTHYRQPEAAEPGGIPAIKEINNDGWCVCGAAHSVMSAVWRQLGWGWRFVCWPGHATVEARYDDRWHY